MHHLCKNCVECAVFNDGREGFGIMAKKRYYIRKGDKTNHGGQVISARGEGFMEIDGLPVACIGDRVSCPKKGHTNCVIVKGATGPSVLCKGKEIARDGDLTSCGARLESSQTLAWHGCEAEDAAELAAHQALVMNAQAQLAARREAAAIALNANNDDSEERTEEIYRVVPNIQINGHFGIFSYVEKVDGGALPEADRLKLTGTPNLSMWMSPDKKRIFFIPDGMQGASQVYFDDSPEELEQEVLVSNNSSRVCIDSMKEQMKVLKEFRKACKGNVSDEDYNDALYSAHMRYWSVLEYLGRSGMSIQDQEYLMTAIEEIGA
jgi:uncharacterized Zn-binding protein involved in type VI secretion